MNEYDAIAPVDKIWLVLADLQHHSDAIREGANPAQRAIRLRRMQTLTDELAGNIRDALAESGKHALYNRPQDGGDDE